jgi:SAM-dependent methyltransferase
VLEVGVPLYAARLGGCLIERLDVLELGPGTPHATVVADLTDAPHLESAAYDTVICTQTLHLIYDVRAAIATLHRILAPGGAALVTVPGISRACRSEAAEYGDFWRFTSLSARRLFEEAFEPASVVVEAFGNVLSSAAFLYGLAAEDVDAGELAARDPDYELLIGIRAIKSRA